MSDIQILLDEENTLVFEVEIQGASTKNLKSRFTIETDDGMDISFDGKLNGKELNVKMPILAHTLEPNTYKCRLEMVLEGEKYSVPIETTVDAILPVKTKAGIKGNTVEKKKQVTGTVIVKDDSIKVEREAVQQEEVKEVTVEEKATGTASGHSHSYSEGDSRTGTTNDHSHSVAEGASRTGTTNDHSHSVSDERQDNVVKILDSKNNLVEIETKNRHFEIKAIDDDGCFEGYGSIFDNVDSYGDVVVKGAFEKTLKERKNVKLLWQHDTREPIGVFTEMYEDSKGLVVKGQIALDVSRGKDAFALLKLGAIDGLSIGFKTIRSKIDKKTNTRQLTEIKLFEVSVVTFPANEVATVTSVKSEMEALSSADEIAVLDFVKSLQHKSAPVNEDHPPSVEADDSTNTPVNEDHLLQQLVNELRTDK